MNQTIESILSRRSCRAFKDEPIPKDQIGEIMRAAIYAPSARNTQSWHFSVVMSREIIKQIAAKMGEALNNPDYNLYDPQVLIISSNKKGYQFGVDDNACALENIFVAAQSFGIGSCWINQMRTIQDESEIRSMLTDMGVPEDHEVFGMAALGSPAAPLPTQVNKSGIVTYIH